MNKLFASVLFFFSIHAHALSPSEIQACARPNRDIKTSLFYDLDGNAYKIEAGILYKIGIPKQVGNKPLVHDGVVHLPEANFPSERGVCFSRYGVGRMKIETLSQAAQTHCKAMQASFEKVESPQTMSKIFDIALDSYVVDASAYKKDSPTTTSQAKRQQMLKQIADNFDACVATKGLTNSNQESLNNVKKYLNRVMGENGMKQRFTETSTKPAPIQTAPGSSRTPRRRTPIAY